MRRARVSLPASSPWCFLLAATASLACAPDESVPVLDEANQPIVGGTRQMACQWPTAVGAAGCTNTLVHPLVVTTAGHCVQGGGPRQITFGDTWSGAGVVRRVAVRRCYNGTASGVRGDFGFCVLAEPVNDVPIVPVLYGCETEILKAGQKATLVGYGRLSGTTNAAGTKYAVDVTVNRVSATEVTLGNATNSACNGDSGGPAFVKLADGTWRAFGATSRGALRCNAATIYTLIHPFVPWMEKTSGIDITPCHDPDGKWNPSAACRSFPVNPEAANGAWATMCTSVQRAGMGATCGAPYSGALPADGGPVITTDAGASSDAGKDTASAPEASVPDTAPPPPPDAAPAPPSNPENPPPTDPGFNRPDARSAPAPAPAPTNELQEPHGGCYCNLQGGSGGGPGSSLALVLIAGILALGRRRRR